jgi:hypothetical protein
MLIRFTQVANLLINSTFLYANLNARVWHHGPSRESTQVMTMALVGKSATILTFEDCWAQKWMA